MTSATLAAGLAVAVPAAGSGDGFEPPTLADFFPQAFLFVGTPFAINRIMMVRLIMTAVLVLFFGIGAARVRVVPGRFQNVCEMLLDFARVNIAEEIIGERRAKPYVPIITTIFLGVLFLNISGIIPGLNIAATSVIGMPIVFAVVAYVVFFYAGIKSHGLGGFLRSSVLPAGVPKALWILIIPIEFLSNLIMRPVTLTIRLLANMVSGHFLLALCYAATSALFFHAAGVLKGLGAVTFGVALAFVLFEVFVATLQAYIFALLTAVYIESSINTH